MHELSIAMRVIDLAEVHCRAEGGGQVVAVTLRIGRLAAVEPHALRTALAMAAVGTLLEEATPADRRGAGRDLVSGLRAGGRPARSRAARLPRVRHPQRRH